MPEFFEDEIAQKNLSKSLLAAARGVDETGNQTVIPVVQEELTVGKRVVETGKGIRVTKTVSEREETVDELLARDDVVFERISLNRVLAPTDIPDIRYEGETTIVPILEEILVVEKRTVLKEEVRITRRHYEVREPQRVVLRSEEVSVEHFDKTHGDALEPLSNAGKKN